MTESVVVDSSAWIEYFAGSPRGALVRKSLAGKQLYIASMAVGEVCAKVEREGGDGELALRTLLDMNIVHQLDSETAFAAARFVVAGKRLKRHLAYADAVHLATADALGFPLVTCDTDFAGMKNVLVIR